MQWTPTHKYELRGIYTVLLTVSHHSFQEKIFVSLFVLYFYFKLVYFVGEVAMAEADMKGNQGE